MNGLLLDVGCIECNANTDVLQIICTVSGLTHAQQIADTTFGPHWRRMTDGALYVLNLDTLELTKLQ